jgi:hypothetical protein
MKKKIAILLILVFLGSSALWAGGANVVGIVFGGIFTAAGVGNLAIMSMSFLNGDDMNGLLSFGAAGVCLGLGIPLLVHNIKVQSNQSKMNKFSQMLEHVSFGTNGKDTYLGVNFSF